MVQVLEPPVAEAQGAPKKRSGGPRSFAGRMRSRENSVKSSLRSKVVFTRDMASRILERNGLLVAQFSANTRYEQMLIADMALAKARSDRTAELLTENENRYIDRTINYWEYDQSARALKLKKRIARDPERVAHNLSGFKQGVELMITTWEGLAQTLVDNGDWDDDQRRLSLDLRGIALELRVGNALLAGKVDPATMAATAAREIARLSAIKKDWLDEHDEYAQDDALAGLAPEDDPTTQRLRRYEKMAKRDYEKALEELKRVQAEGAARSKEGYVKSTLRAWDVDALIERLKTIQEPPGPHIEIQEAILQKARLQKAAEEAKAAAAASEVVEPASPAATGTEDQHADRDVYLAGTETAAPAGTEDQHVERDVYLAGSETAAPAGTEDQHAERDADFVEIESPTAVTPAPSGTSAGSTVPLSRRARKHIQRRLHAANRQAAKNGQHPRGQPQTS